jgi:hypothetical protein
MTKLDHLSVKQSDNALNKVGLTFDPVNHICSLYNKDITQQMLAYRHGVSWKMIHRWMNRRSVELFGTTTIVQAATGEDCPSRLRQLSTT